MPETETPQRLVGLEDALRVLDRGGAMTNAGLARQLGVHRLEVRMVMLQAHWHGLVRATSPGEWAITERGRDALLGGVAPPSLAEQLRAARACVSGRRWRRRWRLAYLTSGSLPVMLGVLVCAAASAAVATNSVPILSTPTAQTRPHRRHHHHRHVRHVRVSTRALARARVPERRTSVVRFTAPARRPASRVAVIHAQRPAAVRSATRLASGQHPRTATSNASAPLAASRHHAGKTKRTRRGRRANRPRTRRVAHQARRLRPARAR